MATSAQIDAQYALERDQIALGLKKLRDNTQQLEEKSYASASIYGVTSIDALLPKVVEQIKETSHDRLTRGTGYQFHLVKEYVAQLEPLASGAIACKVTFDKVFSTKEDSDLLQEVADSIGSAVEAECQIRFYERTVPELLTYIKNNYWHNSSGTQQKLRNVITLTNRHEDIEHWTSWGRTNRIKLGTWLLECIIVVSGWFEREMVQVGRKRNTYIRPTAEFLAQKDKIMKDAELFAPLSWPMLIPPNDWTNDRPGGYLLNEVMRGHDLVRRGQKRCIQGEKVLDYVNKVQRTGFRLNPFIVRVAEILYERGYQVGKFVPIVELPLPNKPADIDTNEEARFQYRRAAAKVRDENAGSFKRSCRTRMTMEAVQRFKDKKAFYLPFSLDYRGRLYPIPSILTPQDTDFGKGLLNFSESAPVTPEAEDWMAFQCATCYGDGLDKATIDERLQWTRDNHDLITRIALDPIDNLHDWENADEPFCFLSACEDYYYCVIDGSRDRTRSLISIDATCSGLQILAFLCRCASTGVLCNVIPGSKPQDAYKAVANASRNLVPERLRDEKIWDRKVVKRCVMTIPYNAKAFSNRDYIREALDEKGVEITPDELTECVDAVRGNEKKGIEGAMMQIVPGPMKVMAWIEREVAKSIKRGAKQLQWTTPSGFVVNQKLNKKLIERMQLQLLGKVSMNIAIDDSDQVDLAHHKNATAPNFIHSLDATVLCLTTLDFDKPIALIHDCVLCRATDMDELSTKVREVAMKIFTDNDVLQDFAKSIGAETDPPMVGDLNPKKVIHSNYFFC